MDITKFCSHGADPRSYLRQPMRLDADVVATNGHILVRWSDMPGDYPEAPETMVRTITNITNGKFSGTFYDLQCFSLPEARSCPACGGVGYHYFLACDECDGEGDFFHGSHWYHCKACKGEGRYTTSQHSEWARKETCYHCDGHGDTHQIVHIGDQAFQRRYIAMLKTLPGLLLEAGINPLATARFTFDGGHGFLMPCRP